MAQISFTFTYFCIQIDTDRYLEWVLRIVKSKGAECYEGRKISGRLFDQEDRLLREYGADAIVNATGLGAAELADDPEVYPVR